MINNEDFNTAKIESFYKSLFENNQEIMLLINPETSEIEDCNLSACSFYGYSYDEMLKLKITNFNMLTKEQIIKEADLAKTEQKNYFYFEHQMSNGQVRDVEVHSTPIVIEGKKLLFSIISDTTNNKIYSDKRKVENTLLEKTVAERTYKLEETNAMMEDTIGTLHKTNNMLSAIFESSPEIIVFTLDSNYCYLAFNIKHKVAVRAIWDKEIEIGMNMLDVIGRHDDREKAKINFDRALAGESFTLIEEYGNENLSRLFWQDFWSPIFSAEGNVIGLTCFALDVTGRKQAQGELEASLSLLHASLESTTDGILVVGKNGSVSLYNQKFVDMWQIPKDILDSNVDEKLLNYVVSKILRPEEFLAKVIELYKHAEETSFDIFEFVDGRIFERYSQPQRIGNEVVGRVWSFRDITEQKQLEESLLVNREELTDIIEFLPDATLAIDQDKRVILWNKAIEKMTGIPAAEMIGKGDYAYTIPFYGKARPQLLDLLFLRDEQLVTQYPILIREGDSLIAEVFCPALYNNKGAWAFVKASPLHDQAGSIIGAIESIRDITDRKRAEDALKESENLYRTFIDASSDMIYLKDDQFKHLVANKSLADFFGKTKREIIGKSDFELMPKSAAEKCRQADMEALSVKSVHVSEEIAGNKVYEANKFPVKLMNSKTGVGGFIRDVTERKQAEIVLKAAKDYLEKLFSYSNGPIIVWNENFEIIKINGAVETLIGRKASEILGKTIEILFPPHQASKLMNLFVNIEKMKDFKTTEIDIVHADGSVRTVLWNLATIYDQDGINSVSTIAQGQDITEIKNAEKNLRYLSYHDHLTGLYNRRYFEEEEKRLNMESQLPISIIMGDINGVKLINDAFGHAEGDRLIVDTAKIIHSCCRGEDVLARTGGGDFSILLPKTDSKTAYEILKKIQTVCNAHNSNISNEAFYINISLGYCTKETVDQDLNKVIKTAEACMYQRKLLEHKSSHSAIIASIKATMLEKNQVTEEHAERLTVLAKMIGTALNLPQTELDELELLATLHDIGKVGIDERILNKPSKLSEDEWVEMKKHPEIGYRIAMSSPELVPIAEYILSHHERWDGKGYPQSIAGTDIPLLSRILAIADAYDAMTQDRPYRKAMTEEAAIAEIIKNAGTQFDPEIARIFIESV